MGTNDYLNGLSRGSKSVGGFSSTGGAGGDCCCSDNSIDRNSAIFFNNLALKLLEMSKTIEARMEELSHRVCSTETKGFLLASIDTPQMVVGVKYEYVEYIKRYGPPSDGIFEEAKLVALRTELGISANSGTI